MTDLDEMNSMTTFRCRKCRIFLFSLDRLESHVGQVSSDLSSFEKCSSWFLKDEDMLPWIAESIEQAQWTEGKIYCPKCEGRIGAFDFIHGIQCNCGKFIIPAIWIQKSRVDHVFPKSQLTNLNIRKPVYSEPSITSDNISVVQNTMDLSGGNVHELDNISSSQNACPSHTEDRSEGQDNCHTCICCGQVHVASVSNTWQSPLSTFHSRDNCEYCWNCKLFGEHRYKEHKNYVGNRNQTIQRPSAKYVNNCLCSLNPVDEALRSKSSSSRAVKVKSFEGSLAGQRSKRIRKGQHLTRSLEDNDLDIREGMSRESQTHQGDAADKNTYSCLTVDEEFDEPITIRHKKVVIPEVQDHHCCAVCLDLLYEPFKCSCDHVFCDPCLRQLNFRTGCKGTIRCPLCRQIVDHVMPASELRTEIRNSYDSHVLRSRTNTGVFDNVERVADTDLQQTDKGTQTDFTKYELSAKIENIIMKNEFKVKTGLFVRLS